MKVCKKCKKKVANKAKVCPNCGSDVSKAKIIAAKSKTIAVKKINIETKEPEKETIPVVEINPKKEDKTSKKNKYQKMMKNNKKTSSKPKKAEQKSKKQQSKLEEKNSNSKKENSTKNKKIKVKVNDKKTSKKENNQVKKSKILEKIKQLNTEILIKHAIKKNKKNEKRLDEKIKKHKKNIDKKKNKQKQKAIAIKEQEKNDKIKKINDKEKIEEQLKNRIRKEEIDKQNKKAQELKNNNKNNTVILNDLSNQVKDINKEEIINTTDQNNIYNLLFSKKVLLFICILLVSITTIYCVMQITGFVFSNDYVTVDKLTYGKTYDMNKRISYNGIVYNVTSATIVEESNYKKPREGYEFVMVTIDLENKSDSKKAYSYKNFKLKNSTEEETTRIFTPVNAQTALYSGSLVIGAKKTGSLVFEAPIDDKNLTLNFYKDPDDNENNEVIYRINIKVSK